MKLNHPIIKILLLVLFLVVSIVAIVLSIMCLTKKKENYDENKKLSTSNECNSCKI